MRLLLNLLAAFSLIHSILMQITPHEIHCNFQYRFSRYTCLLDDVSIITETVPLVFFNDHLPDHTDSSVTGLDTSALWPRNVDIRVVHPQLIQQFPNVQEIQFSNSRIEALAADSFQRCDELTFLSLRGNPLTTIPSRAFQNCANLRTLDLDTDSLTLIDSETFYGLQNLQTLQIGRLLVANNTFEHLPSLRVLRLINTDGIGSNALRHMSQLHTIDISDNFLSLNVIKDAIDGMRSFVAIGLNRNGYTSFDFAFFEQFDNMEDFRLTGNLLTTIPANSFINYRNLMALTLDSNEIVTLIEESFAGLHNLQFLSLARNRLTHLSPNTFRQLINLEWLALSNNILTEMDPDVFNGLQNLDTLHLSSVQLSNLTGMFEHLENLHSLVIIGGRIMSIPPNTFTATKNLRQLNLDLNMITRLNSNSFGYLPFLETFSISHSGWGQGLNEIERNFFDNFPNLVRFGGSGNVCFDGTVNMTLVDFVGETVFDQCFLNWEGITTSTTTTTTTEMTTTPSSNAVAGTAKLWFLIILIVITTVS